MKKLAIAKKVGRFQEFEKCKIASFPHPSGARGVTDKDIETLKEKISPMLTDVKKQKGIKA